MRPYTGTSRDKYGVVHALGIDAEQMKTDTPFRLCDRLCLSRDVHRVLARTVAP